MYLTTSKWMLASIAALLALSTLSTDVANARTIFPAHGGLGDRASRSECDTGEYVVGFKGNTGLWIDRIKPICATVLDKGFAGPSNYNLGYFAGGAWRIGD